jgi:circadian clock protein KaiC
VRRNARALGFDLEHVAFLDLSPSSEFFAEAQTYDIFSPAEVEREPTTQKIVERVESLRPDRVFMDPLTQFRYLSADIFQFRRQVLSFLRFLVDRGSTVMFTSEGSAEAPDDDLQFMSDGVLHLEVSPHGRSICVTKFRGSDFRSGRHSMRLTDRGMEVFPRLLPETHMREFKADTIPSGIPEMDELLGGGIERGTVTIISGPTGVGKTTLGIQFMKEAAGRGERSVSYSFEEEVEILLRRCDSIAVPARQMIERGTLSVTKVEPLQYTPDEFAVCVRRDVEENKTRIVMIDNISGYRLSLRGEDLVSHLHALCKYLQNMGVVVVLLNEVENITGDFRVTEVGISYLADNIIFLRYLEMSGEMRKAIGVLKKRLSNFEKTLREFEISRYGIKIGKPLTGLRGILRGVPEWSEAKREGG